MKINRPTASARGPLALAVLDEKGRAVLALNPAGTAPSPIPCLPGPRIAILGQPRSCRANASICMLAHGPSRVSSLRSAPGWKSRTAMPTLFPAQRLRSPHPTHTPDPPSCSVRYAIAGPASIRRSALAPYYRTESAAALPSSGGTTRLAASNNRRRHDGSSDPPSRQSTAAVRGSLVVPATRPAYSAHRAWRRLHWH
jgi:hypothetical protein